MRKRWPLIVGIILVLALLLILLTGTGLLKPGKSITSFYVVPAGTLRPPSIAGNGPGIPDSTLQCPGIEDRIEGPYNSSIRNFSPILDPFCLTCTEALLTRPIGGFNGDRLFVRVYDYSVNGRTTKPDPHSEINYTFYSRTMQPGNVTYRISHVANLYDTIDEPMPDNISVSISPDRYFAEPGQVYTSVVDVHVKPGTVLRDNFWIFIHADVEGVPDASTDDWVRLGVDDASTMSGLGLYHFYRVSGGYCQVAGEPGTVNESAHLLVVPKGSSRQFPFFVHTGELGTGNVTINLTTMPCNPDHGPPRSDEIPPWPAGISVSVNPNNFTGRSFATYVTTISFTVDPSVTPGDYCFGVILRTPSGGLDFAPFTVRVVPP